MYTVIEGYLKLENYVPAEAEKGMFFKNTLFTPDKGKYFEIWQLDYVLPEEDQMDFFLKHGYPVTLAIYLENELFPFVYSHQIGWFDQGEASEELHDITISELNAILKDHECSLEISIEEELDEFDNYKPFLYEGKCIINFIETT